MPRPVGLTLLCLAATPAAAIAIAQPPAPVKAFERLVRFTANRVVLADVDGDGAPDVVTTRPRAIDVRLNDGVGSFAAPRTVAGPTWTGAPTAGDVDGDGDVDLVLTDLEARIYLNDGRGTFSRSPHGATIGGLTPTLADLDGDADLDYVVVGPANTLLIALNDGGGRFAPAPNRAPLLNYRGVHLHDADGDADPDLIATMVDGRGIVLTNDGTATFAAPGGALPGVRDTVRVAAADFDGDGRVDLFFTRVVQDGRVERDALLLRQADGSYRDASARLPRRIQHVRADVRATDVDADGDADLVIWSESPSQSPRVFVFANDGSATFVDATPTRLGVIGDDGVTHVRLADVDRDGDLDLFVGLRRSAIEAYVNRHRQVELGAAPRPGGSLSIVVDAAPGYASAQHVALPWLGTRGTPAPLPPGIGTASSRWVLEPSSLIRVSTVLVPPRVGRASTTLAVPNDPRLTGLVVGLQAIVLGPTGSASITNAAWTRVR